MTVEIGRLVGLLMLVPAVTLFLLYVFRPRPYVLAGVTAWAAASVMVLVLGFDSRLLASADSQEWSSVGRAAVATWAMAALVFGAGIRLASVWFRAPTTIRTTFFWAFPIAFAWTIVAISFMRPMAVVWPASAMMTVWQALGAWTYFSLGRTQRLVGPLITGLGVTGMAAVSAAALTLAALAGGLDAASPRVVYFYFISASLLVLGMHLLIFEDVIQELP